MTRTQVSASSTVTAGATTSRGASAFESNARTSPLAPTSRASRSACGAGPLSSAAVSSALLPGPRVQTLAPVVFLPTLSAPALSCSQRRLRLQPRRWPDAPGRCRHHGNGRRCRRVSPAWHRRAVLLCKRAAQRKGRQLPSLWPPDNLRASGGGDRGRRQGLPAAIRARHPLRLFPVRRGHAGRGARAGDTW